MDLYVVLWLVVRSRQIELRSIGNTEQAYSGKVLFARASSELNPATVVNWERITLFSLNFETYKQWLHQLTP